MNSCWKKLSLCARQEVDRDNQTTQKLVSSNKTNQQTNEKKKKKKKDMKLLKTLFRHTFKTTSLYCGKRLVEVHTKW